MPAIQSMFVADYFALQTFINIASMPVTDNQYPELIVFDLISNPVGINVDVPESG